MPKKFFRKGKIMRLLFVASAIVLIAATGFFLYSKKLLQKTQSVNVSAVCKQSDHGEKLSCWEDLIDKTLKTDGLDAAFAIFADLYSTDPVFASDCHSFTHSLGRAAYLDFSQKKQINLSSKSFYCGYGFYHGFMESLLADSGDIEKAREFCKYADDQLSREIADAGGACFHGIGHGAVDGGDPGSWGNPQAMIVPALSLCEKVSQTDLQLFRCSTGVYNALDILSQDSKYKLTEISSDPYSFCRTQKPFYKQGCYTNLLPVLQRLKNYDFLKTAEVIVQEDEQGSYNVRSDFTTKQILISDLFHDFIRANFREDDSLERSGIDLCHKLEYSFQLACVDGLAGGFMKYGKPKKEYVWALAFCDFESLSVAEKDVCFRQILTRLRNFYSLEKTREICKGVEKLYRDKYCNSAN